METQTVYKVLRRRQDGYLESAINHGNYYTVVYGEKFPNFGRDGTPLLAFDNLSDATWFILTANNSNFELWECQAYNVKPVDTVFVVYFAGSSNNDYAKFWAGELDHEEYGTAPPQGTVACHSIKLVRRLDPDQP
jgi:hypothetical protein